VILIKIILDNQQKKVLAGITSRKKQPSHLTSDQKKIRTLSYLQSQNTPTLMAKLFTKISKKTLNRKDLFLDELKDANLIEMKPVEDNPNKNGYMICKKGRDVIDIIKLIKNLDQEHPIFSLSLFNMTDEEKEQPDAPLDNQQLEQQFEFEKILDFHDSKENIEKIMQKLGLRR
jgi:DNA-binding HxlR family transcriptional regulator